MAVTETLASSCVNQIRNLILRGDLLPGERIKGDYLKSQLGVGLSPIREALARLISSSLIESTDNQGFRVAQIYRSSVYDTYKSAAKIEILLLREAIDCGDEVWESTIVAALYLLSKIEKTGVKANYKLWSAHNEAFHAALIKGCDLTGLKSVRAHFSLIKEWYHNLAYGNVVDELIAVNHSEHSKIAALALARNADAACMLLYQHSLQSFNSLVSTLTQRGYLSANVPDASVPLERGTMVERV